MDSAIESFAKGVKFSLRHCAFQSENQAIVEKSGMIQAIIISEQGIGNGTHIEKAIPIRITPCQAGDLQPKKNSHSSHSNFHIQVIKSGTFDERFARNTEVFIDGAHLIPVPAERNRFLDECVLPRGRLRMVLHLGRMRLTNVDDGSSLPVTGFYFVVIDHDLPPPIPDSRNLLEQSVWRALRWPGFWVPRAGFPIPEFPEWGYRESSACVAR